VKCRPPENRAPEPDESAACGAFLRRQIDIVQPRVLVLLGSVAAQYVLGTRKSMALLRGSVHRYRGALVIPTYHPAYLLRNPAAKREVWEDLQKAMGLLGIPVPKRGGAPGGA
jgi:DNA polymerase